MEPALPVPALGRSRRAGGAGQKLELVVGWQVDADAVQAGALSAGAFVWTVAAGVNFHVAPEPTDAVPPFPSVIVTRHGDVPLTLTPEFVNRVPLPPTVDEVVRIPML